MNIAHPGLQRIPLWQFLTRGVAGMLVALMLVFAGFSAHAAPPPANTSISNQASATYSDGSGASREVLSNLVYTTVQQVYSHTLTADGAQNATPGSIVYYPHTLTNTGNGADTYSLAAVSTSGAFTAQSIQIFADNGSGQPTGPAITSTGLLASGASFKFIVSATVPATATAAQTNTMTVTGASTTPGVPAAAVSKTNTDVTTVTANAVVTLTKAISASSGPSGGAGTYTYTLTYTNTGNSDATLVTIGDQVPAGMTYQSGQSRWSVTGATALSDTATATVQGSTPNRVTTSFTAGKFTAVLERVSAGQSGFITFQVKVDPSVAPGVINNTATLAYNNGAATVNGNSNTVPFTVVQTAGVTVGNGTPVTGPVPAGSVVTFTNRVTNTGNGSDTFNITYGPGTPAFPPGTTFQLYKTDGSTPLVDTNGDGVADTGPVNPNNGFYDVVIKATLPPNAPTSSTPVSVLVTAKSVFDASKTAFGTDTLNAVTAASVDLMYTTTKGNNPDNGTVVQQTISANPGTTQVFTLLVKNTSLQPDTYDLVASTTAGVTSLTLPTGWTVDFKADASGGACTTTGASLTNTGTINAGASSTFCAVVTVPAGYTAGANNLYFRAQSPSSTAQDILRDELVINAVRSLSITPNGAGQTYPGGSFLYKHTLTNNGNVDEGGTNSLVALAAANNNTGWTSTLYYDANNNGTLDATDPVITTTLTALNVVLARSGSITVFNKVIAPSGAVAGAINATTITVTTTNVSPGGYVTVVPAPALSTDSTTVIAGNLTLLKEQALDATCATALAAQTGWTQGNLNAQPGQCVAYRITVTNVGAADATNVVVSDSTPTYTTIATGGTAITSAGQVTGPAANASGTIKAYVGTGGTSSPAAGGTVAAGQSVTITFKVKIAN